MKHIVLMTTSYPVEQAEGQAAAGSFVADFALELSSHVRVTVIAPAMYTKTVHNKQLTTRYFAVPFLPLSLLKISNPMSYPAIVRTLMAGYQALETVQKQQKIDHVLALWSLPSGYWAYRLYRKYGTPYSTWSLGSDIWSLGKIPLIRSLLATVLLHSHICFADGYQLADDVTSMTGKPCVFLSSSRNLNSKNDKTLSTSPPYRLAYLGRWHPNKGIDILMHSLQQLTEHDWKNIECVRICGGGSLKEMVYDIAADLDTHHRPVSISGYLDKQEALDLLQWADYVIIPSRIESIPVIFSDAMQCNCPVICMPVGDLPRLMKEYQVGICAASVDATHLRDAILQMLQQRPTSFVKHMHDAAIYFNSTETVKQFLKQIF